MRTVRDEAGREYLLVKRAADSSLVRDPATGDERYVRTDRLEVIDREPPLSTAATAVPEPVRTLCRATHDDRSLGLVVEVVDRGPLAVAELLDAYELCESDLHGLLGELCAAGLLDETRTGGRRGYAATPTAREAVERLRE